MLEKVISVFGLFFVTSYVAKYIGPELFGTLSLATAIFQIVQIVAQLGGDNIIFKRIAKNEASGVLLMISSSLMRGALYIILSLPVVTYFYLFIGGYALYFSIAVAISCLFLSLDVIAIYNNAILRSKSNTIANAIGLIISLIARYLIALFKLDPVFLSVPIVLASAIPFFIRLYFFNKKNIGSLTEKLMLNRKSLKYSKYLLFSGVSIVLASVSIAVYTRINQLLISNFLGNKELGLYAAALTLSTSWGFVLTSVTTSFFPSIYAESSDYLAMKKTSSLNRIIFILGTAFCLFIFFFGKAILNLLYGPEFSGAYLPMIILCVATLFSALGTVSYRYIVKYSGFSFLSKKMVFVLILSAPLSMLLVNWAGIVGAAISVVIVEFLSLTIINYFFKEKIVLRMHLMSILNMRGKGEANS